MGCGNKSQNRTFGRRAGPGCATVNEVVIKRRRTGLLDDVLQNCPCVRFVLEPAIYYLYLSSLLATCLMRLSCGLANY